MPSLGKRPAVGHTRSASNRILTSLPVDALIDIKVECRLRCQIPVGFPVLLDVRPDIRLSIFAVNPQR